jgi:uncharacterized protein with ACT and thioredoxin-like domain
MKHTISVLLQNKPGVLSRVTGLFSGRGFNSESLSVAQQGEDQGRQGRETDERNPLEGHGNLWFFHIIPA